MKKLIMSLLVITSILFITVTPSDAGIIRLSARAVRFVGKSVGKGTVKVVKPVYHAGKWVIY